MRERIVFQDNDRIAVIAPHPDDECLGTAAVLLLAPERTDIYVLTDGSHGNPEKSIEEEAEIAEEKIIKEEIIITIITIIIISITIII